MKRRNFLRNSLLLGAAVTTAVIIPKESKAAYVVDEDECIGCGLCENECPTECIQIIRVIGTGQEYAIIDPDCCNECGACCDICPSDAIRIS